MKLSWQHVAVILGILAAVTAVVWRGNDPTPIIGLALAILIGIGLVQQGEIKAAANGSMSRLISLMETMAEQLRHLPPPPTPRTEEPSNGSVSAS